MTKCERVISHIAANFIRDFRQSNLRKQDQILIVVCLRICDLPEQTVWLITEYVFAGLSAVLEQA